MRRICEHCGKPITFGCMTNDYGDFYIHEECFDDWFEKQNEYERENIYYTEYEREELEDE